MPIRMNAYPLEDADAQIIRAATKIVALEKMLRAQTQLVERAVAHLDNDLYATRVVNCHAYLEMALEDTKDEYGWEASQ